MSRPRNGFVKVIGFDGASAELADGRWIDLGSHAKSIPIGTPVQMPVLRRPSAFRRAVRRVVKVMGVAL